MVVVGVANQQFQYGLMKALHHFKGLTQERPVNIASHWGGTLRWECFVDMKTSPAELANYFILIDNFFLEILNSHFPSRQPVEIGMVNGIL